MENEGTELSPADMVAAAFNDTSSVSEPAVAEVVPEVTAPVSSGGHPAWGEILSQVPEVLHDRVRPTLEKWDKGFEEKLAAVHSQYDPYKGFIGQSPDEIQAGLQIVRALNDDPAAFYKQIGEFYKLGSGQGPQATQTADTLDLGEFAAPVDPRIAELEKQQADLSSRWQAQESARMAKEAEQWLDTRQREITEKLAASQITPDWKLITPLAAQYAQQSGNYDAALDQATADYVATVNSLRVPVANTTAPPVLTPNGSLPAYNPNQLSDDDTKKLLVQSLEQAFKGR